MPRAENQDKGIQASPSSRGEWRSRQLPIPMFKDYGRRQ